MPKAFSAGCGKASGSCSPIAANPLPGWCLSPPLRPLIRHRILFSTSALALSPALKGKPNTPKSTKSFMAAADVLIDTAGFLALWDASDEHHKRAVDLQAALRQKGRHFLTTD